MITVNISGEIERKETFVPNQRYCDLLLANEDFNKRVRAGKVYYTSKEYKDMQKELLDIELKISSAEIIQHAEYLFPKVGQE